MTSHYLAKQSSGSSQQPHFQQNEVKFSSPESGREHFNLCSPGESTAMQHEFLIFFGQEATHPVSNKNAQPTWLVLQCILCRFYRFSTLVFSSTPFYVARSYSRGKEEGGILAGEEEKEGKSSALKRRSPTKAKAKAGERKLRTGEKLVHCGGKRWRSGVNLYLIHGKSRAELPAWRRKRKSQTLSHSLAPRLHFSRSCLFTSQ